MSIRFAVVDDAAFLRELLKSILTSQGHICVGEAANGEEAIQLIERTLPDLVMLDIVMPGRTGIETAKALKEIYPDLKIVGCSTIDEPHLVEKAYDAGFDAYVLKPFTKDQIIQAVNQSLARRRESSHGSF